MIARETIYQALFVQVQTAADFITAERRLRHEGDVPAEECPALFQFEASEQIARKRGTPPQYILQPEIWIYLFSPDGQDTPAPSQVLNPMLDSLQAALEPTVTAQDGTLVNNLGLPQAVSHCWISGTIKIFEGVLGDRILAIVPINILAT